MKLRLPFLLLLLLLLAATVAVFPGAAAAGPDGSGPKGAGAAGAPGEVPAWASPTSAQAARAKALGVPVAFENDLGMRFVLIPEGPVWMGSPATEAGRNPDERRHRVRLSRPYYLQVSEVTNAEVRAWQADHASGAAADAPAGDLSWEDAKAFAAWLTSHAKDKVYRLPTEAEWARGRRSEGEGSASASWGLQRMSGSQWEWCADVYAPFEGADQVDPAGPVAGEGALRVLRGGSSLSWDEARRPASRSRMLEGHAAPDVGLRLVVEIPGAPKAAPPTPARAAAGAAWVGTWKVDRASLRDSIVGLLRARGVKVPAGKDEHLDDVVTQVLAQVGMHIELRRDATFEVRWGREGKEQVGSGTWEVEGDHLLLTLRVTNGMALDESSLIELGIDGDRLVLDRGALKLRYERER